MCAEEHHGTDSFLRSWQYLR